MSSDPQEGRAKEKLRVDKWLWQARFVKSRSLAAALATGGHVRVNGAKIAKASHGVGAGDVLVFPQGNRIRMVRVLALGLRRGPATEAQALYDDLDTERPENPQENVAPIQRNEGNARPTKRDRRKLDLDRSRALE
ncbi:RNA-binding S4 domain-containing protein [Pseudooceanicola sp. LIPI14-2-Ac024]|uniref:RNA-binding S4 domain-containing protein n=1 Tax=Pseudooceanicola sp. LIPI14-2-Ac024 TaxID=3344875 RepID=UPI0035CEB2B5